MSRKQMDDEEQRAVSEEIVAEETVAEETVSETTTSETTTSETISDTPFDPEIDEKVLFCPYDGNDHIVTILGKPENGTTKWLTSEGPINACYLKQLNPEDYGYSKETADA